MVTLYEFSILGLSEKAEATWQHGQSIGIREQDGHRILLYDLRSFNVAVWYHVANNKIAKIESFRSTRLLEQFIDDLNVADLYE